MAMSIEYSGEGNAAKWHAGKVEKIGAGVSVVLMGGAFFFPETGKLLATAAASVALLDLAIINIKSFYIGIGNDINRMNREEMASWLDN